MPKSRKRTPSRPRAKNDYDAGRQAAERNLARGVAPGSSIMEGGVDTAPSSGLSPLGLEISSPDDRPLKRVPDPKVSVGGVEINGEAKAQALGDLFGPAAAEFSRKWGRENESVRSQAPYNGLNVSGAQGRDATAKSALKAAQDVQTETSMERDKALILEIVGPDTSGITDRAALSARLNEIAATDLQTHAEAFQRLSGVLLMGLQSDGAAIPPEWIDTALDREKSEAFAAMIEISAEMESIRVDQRRLALDGELLRRCLEEGDDPADPRLVLLSAETRDKAKQDGRIVIDPEVEAAISEDMREQVLHVVLGKDARFEPISGKPSSMRLNPVRVIATGDLRKAQMRALIEGVPADQCIDARLDTLLDDGGVHFLVMDALLDDNFSPASRPFPAEGAPPEPFMAAAVRCRIWAKTAFSGPNQAIETQVTLPLQTFMMTPAIEQMTLPHPSYRSNAAKVTALGQANEVPLFEVSLEELTGTKGATYPVVQPA